MSSWFSIQHRLYHLTWEGAGIWQQYIIIPYVLKKCYALILAVAKAVSIPKALTLDTFFLEIRLWSHALRLYFFLLFQWVRLCQTLLTWWKLLGTSNHMTPAVVQLDTPGREILAIFLGDLYIELEKMAD